MNIPHIAISNGVNEGKAKFKYAEVNVFKMSNSEEVNIYIPEALQHSLHGSANPIAAVQRL
jgi:hypothetical protein